MNNLENLLHNDRSTLRNHLVYGFEKARFKPWCHWGCQQPLEDENLWDCDICYMEWLDEEYTGDTVKNIYEDAERIAEDGIKLGDSYCLMCNIKALLDRMKEVVETRKE